MSRIIPALALTLLVLSCGSAPSTTGLAREEIIGMADRLYSDGKWAEASLLYTELQFRFPGDELYDFFLYRSALCERERRRWADAEFYLYRVVNEFPRGAWADNAQFALAETMWMQRRDHRRDPAPVIRAREELLGFMSRYPGSALMESARELLEQVEEHLALRALETGRFYLRRNKPDSAILYLREALDNYSEASCRGEIMITIADAYLAQGNRFSARSYYRRARDECLLTPGQAAKVEERLSEIQ